MNEVFDVQYSVGSTPIAEVGISEKNQDDIIKCLYGIRELYKDEEAREKLVLWLASVLPPEMQKDNEKAEICIWCILVLAVLKRAISCSDDHLTMLANEARVIRQMMRSTMIVR